MITKNKDNNAVDNPNFIGSWNIDKNICKKIIEFYEKNDESSSNAFSGNYHF